MRRETVCAALVLSLLVPAAYAATSVEKIRNDKVVVTEDTLGPGESEPLSTERPSELVYMNDGTAEITHGDKTGEHKVAVKEGEVAFEHAGVGSIKNDGAAPLHFARIEFLTDGSSEVWGMTGLAPNYKMLLENKYARAYDIRIAAGEFEPQHTHHARVVISLSGATLEHILPDGTHQPSTLKTGEIVYRPAATHVGHNLGTTNLWVIAVEPK